VTQSRIANRTSAIIPLLALLAGLATAGEAPPPGLPDVRSVVRERGKAVVKIETTEHFLPGLFRRTTRLLNPFPLRRAIGDAFSLAFFVPSALVPQLRKHVGSGVVIEPDGHLLTNHHVIRDADEVLVRLTDAKEVKRQFEGTVLGKDKLCDAALVKFDPEKAPIVAAPLGDSDTLEPGDWVVVIGQPLNLTGSVTVGIVSGRHRQLGPNEVEDYLQIDAAVNPGNSGGPVFDAQGRVVGIVTLGIFPANDLGFAVPISLIAPTLDDLKAHGHPRRGYLGITVEDVTPKLAKEEELDVERGALITRVRWLSPADKAGFQRGDVVVSAAGKEVGEARDLQMQVLLHKPDDEIPVVVRRDGKLHTLRPALRERRKPFRIF